MKVFKVKYVLGAMLLAACGSFYSCNNSANSPEQKSYFYQRGTPNDSNATNTKDSTPAKPAPVKIDSTDKK